MKNLEEFELFAINSNTIYGGNGKTNTSSTSLNVLQEQNTDDAGDDAGDDEY